MDGNEQIDNTIESFSLSHGLNYALGDVVYRWFPGRRGEDFLGHLQPYAGVGLGLAIPHVESNVNGTFHEEYQVHGPGLEGLAGLNVMLSRHWGLMFEYKFTYANLDSLEIPRGSIAVTPPYPTSCERPDLPILTGSRFANERPTGRLGRACENRNAGRFGAHRPGR